MNRKPFWDRTKLNLFSIVLGGAGIFAGLIGFSVPELNMMFLGENPFAVKRDAIAEVMGWMFASLAGVALLIQVLAEILGERIPPRLQHTRKPYVLFTLVLMILVFGLIVWVFPKIGQRIAKNNWLPKVVAIDAGFEGMEFQIRHNGWRQDQLAHTNQIPASYRLTNLKSIEDNISMKEKLLELPPMKGDLTARIARLKPYYPQ